PEIARRVAKTCSLAPEAVNDFEPVLKLADRGAADREQHLNYRWYVLTRGLAEYRAGHFAAAVEWMDRFSPEVDGGHCDATAFAWWALAKHRLSKGRQEPRTPVSGSDQPDVKSTRLAEEARTAVAHAEAILSKNMPDPNAGRPFGGDFQDWLHARVLTNE